MQKILRLMCLVLQVVVWLPQAWAIESVKGCTTKDEYSKVTFLLIDRSDKREDTEHLQQSLEVLKTLIGKGERLVVVARAATASDPHVLMDVVNPASSIWVSALQLRRKQNKFADCMERLLAAIEVQDEETKQSAIIETLESISNTMMGEQINEKRLVLLSDMIQHSEVLSFYKTDLSDSTVLLDALAEKSQIPPFPGTNVYIGGASSLLGALKTKEIETFWRGFFERANSQVKFYGPVLVANE